MRPQWHFLLMTTPHSGQGGGWQPFGQACTHPTGRAMEHPSSQLAQPGCCCISSNLGTEWQTNAQLWLPHFNFRAHFRAHDCGLEFQQGQSATSCPPMHVTLTGSSQRGCGKARYSYWKDRSFYCMVKFKANTADITLLSRERTAASAGLDTRIAAWQRALQMCEQLLVLLGKPHGCAQGGHSPLWQRCFMAWWHLAVILWSMMFN